MPAKEEVHPAWGMIGASRISHSPPGKVLFNSDVRHQHYVVIRLEEASRTRDLHRDWIHGTKRIAEIAMSEAQWASFVSSMNSSGVPATIEYRVGFPNIPAMEFEPRLQESMNEVRDAARRAQEKVKAAFDVYAAHKTVGNLRALQAAIDSMPSNIAFAAESLSEHAENVVQRAKADVEAFVSDKARQLGIDPADVLDPMMLTEGDSD